MRVEETKLKGCFVIEPKVFEDTRGVFFESFNQKEFEEFTGIKTAFVQDNQSISSKGVLRGLHFQRGEFSQAKLVRVIKGIVQDVIVDLRPNSQTFGEYISIILSKENNTQIFIPRGMAHGFLTLENDTIFSYKCDNYYNKLYESGIIYNDINLDIKWNIIEKKFIVSEKDLNLPKFKNLEL